MRTLLCLTLFTSSLSYLSLAQSFTNLTALQGNLHFVTVSEQHGVVITGGIEAYKSLDAGATWTELNDDFFTSALYPFDAEEGAIVNTSTFIFSGKNVFDNTYSLLKTTDGGTTWSIGITGANPITAIEVNGNVVIATTEDGIYRSIDTGNTWTFINLSSTGDSSPFVEYHQGTNNWLISGYGGAILSSPNGTSWTNQTMLNATEMRSLDASSSLFLASSTGVQNEFYSINNSFVAFGIQTINTVHFQTNQLENSFLLASGDVLCNDQTSFYLIDTTNGFVSTYQHQLMNNMGTGSIINDLDVDQTIGFAVGNSGAISKVDLSQNGIVYVPADFSLSGVSSCVGDSILAIPVSPFYDSIQWFYQGSYIGNLDTLTYTTPGLYGTNYLKATTWLNGTDTSDSTSIYYPPLYPPSTYNYVADTSVCYGNPSDIAFYGLPSSNNSNYIEFQVGGQTFYGPALTPTSNFSLTSPPLFADDTLWMIQSRVQTCGTTFDTTLILIDVSANLSSVNIEFNDTVVCSGEDVQIQLTNIEPGSTYDISRTSGTSSSMDWSSSQMYNTSDTLSFTAPGIDINASNNPATFNNFYSYYEITITDSIGCSTALDIDSIRIARSTADFTLSGMTMRTDTVDITNEFVTPNRLWTSQNLPIGGLTNPTGITPVIFSDTIGVFNLQLRNEPVLGCVDSLELPFILCDSLTSFSNIGCPPKKETNAYRILKTKMDQFGNTYSTGIYKTGPFGTPGYIFSKFDPEGNLIWEKRSNDPNYQWGSTVLEGFDFDDDGNPYCLVWADSDMGTWGTGWFVYTPISFSHTQRGYIVKVNKNTGNPIWTKDVTTYPITFFNSSGWRLCDLLINDDIIYFSGNRQTALFIAATDLDGNYISGSTSSLAVTGTGLVPQSTYTGANSEEYTRFSPQLGILSSGEVIGSAFYFGNHPVLQTTQPQLVTTGSVPSLMLFKYTMGSPLYDLTKVAEHTNYFFPASSHPEYIPFFTIDQDDNITCSYQWVNGKAKILDSIYPYNYGSAIFQVDQNFNKKWVATSPYYNKISGIHHVKSNNNLVISGQSGINLGYSTDSTSYLYQKSASEDGTIEFILTLNQDGTPLGAHNFELINNVPNPYQANVHTSVSPCGEMLALVNELFDTPSMDSMFYDNQLYDLDSLMVFNLGSCSTLNCSYVQFADNVSRCSNASEITIPVSCFFNADSINYELIENGTVISSGGFTFASSDTIITISYLGTADTLLFTTDLSINDTTLITISNLPSPNYSFPDTLCNGASATIIGTPSSYYYSFFGNPQVGNTYDYTNSDYAFGANSIFVEHENTDGCFYMDTLEIEIVNNVPPTYSFPDTICLGSAQSVLGSPVSYNYSYLNGSINANPMYIITAYYSIGNNIIDVHAESTHGCIFNDTLNFFMENCGVGLTELNEDYILIYPNPTSAGCFVIDLGQIQEEAQVGIYSINGKLIQKIQDVSSDVLQVNISVEAGTYIVHVTTDEFEIRKKLLIIH